MTKASPSRVKRRRQRHGQLKPRQEQIHATTKGVVSSISFTYDSSTDEMSFDTPVENTYIETSYRRDKAPKVVNRIPLRGENLQFNSTDALLRNYEPLIAIDTNTRKIAGRRISVTGTIIGKTVTAPDGSKGVAWRCPLCVELADVVATYEERVGWIEGLRALYGEGLITERQRIGLIVDAHFNDLKAINAQNQAVLEGVMLPENVTLIYASADTGGEYLANTMIRGADRSATMTLDYLEAGKAPINEEPLRMMYFKGRRIIFPRQANFVESELGSN